ncbi:MAG: hypothetical protein ACD_17C00280G0004 [uncultured bacterium]|nr:MAG: hypothetical protein ACD_17C00280G0004 [uncultured bacterium]
MDFCKDFQAHEVGFVNHQNRHLLPLCGFAHHVPDYLRKLRKGVDAVADIEPDADLPEHLDHGAR